MKQPLFLLVSLVLVSFCRGQDWTAPDFCHGEQCPQYELVDKNQDFEERLYVATEWITTKIEGSAGTDVMVAHSRLKAYCQRQNDAGVLDKTWPSLITVTEGQDLSMSWFVPPGTTKLDNTDPSVTLTTRPKGTVYVRVFSGTPSIESGKENAKMLWNALDEHCADLPTYTGAGYDSYFSPIHHNEIWIYADDINCKKDK